MGYQLPLPFFKDEARRKSLQEILENMFVSFDEQEKEFESKLDSYLNIVTQLKEIFSKNYSVWIGGKEYRINVKTLDKEALSKSINNFNDKWVISIDESQHAEEEIGSSVFYRNSLAFGFKLSKNKKDERILSIISTIKFDEDSEVAKRKIDLQTYIQNLLVGIYATAILISQGEKIHSILMDGPLVRMLGPFLTIKFTEEELKKIFTIDKDIGNINNLPNTRISILNKNLSLSKIADGTLFNVIKEDEKFKKIIDNLNGNEELKTYLQLNNQEIPGIVIYFYLLRILIDLSNKYNFHLVSCVKSTERTTEFLMVYLINALIKYLSEHKRSSLYNEFKTLLKKDLKIPRDAENILRHLLKLNIKDDQIITFALDYSNEQANYLEPVEIRRYRSISKNKEDIKIDIENSTENISSIIYNWKFGSADSGVQHEFLEGIVLKNIFDNYTILMSYVRTSELKAPLRIEFPDYKQEEKIKDIISSIYLFSYPYQNYGIPIMLKYADDLVRVPSETFKTISKSFVSEKLINTLLSRELSIGEIKPMINSILNLYKRDFLSRGGIL